MEPLFTKSHPPQHICILRLSAIGDVCHAVAVLRLIQAYYPQTKITWIIGKVEATLVGDIPGVEFIIFDKAKGWRAYWDCYRACRQQKFDLLFHMQVSIRASLVSLCVRAKYRLGFDKERAKDMQWLFTNKMIAAQEKPHVIEGFLAFLSMIDISDRQLQWNIPLSENDKAYAESICENNAVLIINPASSVASRNWTAEGYAACCAYAVNHLGLRVVLTGGRSALERELADKIKTLANVSIVDVVGQTTLKQLLALIAKAKIVLAPDTGPAHMATAVGTPVIGLYANTNPDRAAPYLSKEWVVSAYPEVMQAQFHRSVDQLPFGKRAHDPLMMSHIAIDKVIDKLKILAATI